MLLTAIMAGSVFSIALTAKRSSGRGLRKLIADQAGRQLSEQLKNYVKSTAYLDTDTTINGPGSGSNPWSMIDSVVSDSCSNTSPPPSADPATCYALLPGSHTLRGYLPGWFEAAPYNARMKYWVMNQTVDGMNMPHVNITVDWKEL